MMCGTGTRAKPNGAQELRARLRFSRGENGLVSTVTLVDNPGICVKAATAHPPGHSVDVGIAVLIAPGIGTLVSVTVGVVVAVPGSPVGVAVGVSVGVVVLLGG